MSSGAQIINKSYARERAEVRYISHSLFQQSAGCKNPVAHSHCATKNLLKKKNFKPSLHNGSAPKLSLPLYLRCTTLSSFGKRLRFSGTRCMMHDLDVGSGPSSFRIPELLSNGTALPKSGVLAFYRVVSLDTMRCR